jgi:hypothetical protein
MLMRALACLCLLCLSMVCLDAAACIPQREGSYIDSGFIKPLPVMPPDKVVAFVHVSSSKAFIQASAVTYEVVDIAGERVDGAVTLIPLTCDTKRDIYTTMCSNLIAWRPAARMAEGDYTLQITLGAADNPRAQPAVPFTVSASATLTPLAPPRLTATLTAIPEAGPERSCCPIARRTMWGGGALCNPDDAYVSVSESSPRGLIGCGGTIGDPCKLCWPTQLLAAPRLTARWEVDAAHPAYYKANSRDYDWLDKYGKDRGISNQYVDHAERQFTAAEAAERYCMTVTAVSLIDGSEASAEVCADHAQLDPALPSIPALPDLCVAEPAPDGPGDDAGGGCATAPGAPAGAAPLWLLGALWAVRRRLDGRRAR